MSLVYDDSQGRKDDQALGKKASGRTLLYAPARFYTA